MTLRFASGTRTRREREMPDHFCRPEFVLLVSLRVNMPNSFAFHLFFAVVLWGAAGCRAARDARRVPPEVVAEWDVHHDAERDGDTDEAIEGYRAMCDRTPPYPRACFDYARMQFEVAPTDVARKITERTIERYPGEALAQSAVKRLRRSYGDDVESGMTALGRLAKTIAGTEIHDTVLFEMSRLARSAGDTVREAETLRRLMAGHNRWDSQLWDNAAWRLVAIYQESGDVDEERKMLKALIRTKEPSALLGSYTSPYYDDALLRLGEIQLSQGAHQQAYDTFMTLAASETSSLRESGRLGAARVRRAQGNTRAACQILSDLLKLSDMNRHTRRDAEALSREIGCNM